MPPVVGATEAHGVLILLFKGQRATVLELL